MNKKRITFTVTNDLVYDQRMQRICSSLQKAGYKVTLVGRDQRTSTHLRNADYRQVRLASWFSKGKLMYAEFNLRLFTYLLFHSTDAICAIDLDTILPCYFTSALKGTIRIYDAHELFTEQKEIVTRPLIQKLWLAVERFAVPKFENGYTVNTFIAEEFERRYNVKYTVVKNMPVLKPLPESKKEGRPFIIYQGAVNEGRSFETLIPAMKEVECKLVICGNGNFFEQVKKLIKKNKVADKVELRDYVPPDELAAVTPTSHVAVTLFEKVGLNQYNSLSNRFFDYIMAGVPQVCVGYPEYEAINDKYGIAYLIYNTDASTIALALNNLLHDDVLHNTIRQNCLKAREELNWGTEEKVLIEFYDRLFMDKALAKRSKPE
jgi:glycosyltransferase involved in cell wall biosynthesis